MHACQLKFDKNTKKFQKFSTLFKMKKNHWLFLYSIYHGSGFIVEVFFSLLKWKFFRISIVYFTQIKIKVTLNILNDLFYDITKSMNVFEWFIINQKYGYFEYFWMIYFMVLQNQWMFLNDLFYDITKSMNIYEWFI